MHLKQSQLTQDFYLKHLYVLENLIISPHCLADALNEVKQRF